MVILAHFVDCVEFCRKKRARSGVQNAQILVFFRSLPGTWDPFKSDLEQKKTFFRGKHIFGAISHTVPVFEQKLPRQIGIGQDDVIKHFDWARGGPLLKEIKKNWLSLKEWGGCRDAILYPMGRGQ